MNYESNRQFAVRMAKREYLGKVRMIQYFIEQELEYRKQNGAE